jgi:hypothetical protein
MMGRWIMAFDTNPFAVFTFIAGPAVLTNASSVLALGTSNRFARNVERARLLIKTMEGKTRTTDHALEMRLEQLTRTERRATLLLRALSSFYFSLGCFAASSLLSLLGAVLSMVTSQTLHHAPLIIATFVGILGMCGLVIGCALLIRETRLALQSLREDTSFFRRQHEAAEAVGNV